jgi:hypothetical protein
MRAASRKVHRVLLIDVGGTHVKMMATGQSEERRIPSASKMTAAKMVRTRTFGGNEEKPASKRRR